MAKQGKSWTENVFPDRYARNARLYPSLLVIAPTVIAIVAVAGLELSWLKMLWLGLGAVGGTYWLSQLARDPGKVLENKLWESWGGMPSVAILRHGDRRIDAITKARYHARLVELVPNTSSPAPDVERNGPDAADICYAAWSTHLRNSTRDQKRFPLVFGELVSYGYRRNLLGLRPYGLTSSILGCLIFGVFFGAAIYNQHGVQDTLWLALGAEILLLLFWLIRVSPAWVRLTAENYAARLVEAVDDLYGDHAKVTAKAQVEKPKKPRSVKKSP
jgi:hypothetical protein